VCGPPCKIPTVLVLVWRILQGAACVLKRGVPLPVRCAVQLYQRSVTLTGTLTGRGTEKRCWLTVTTRNSKGASPKSTAASWGSRSSNSGVPVPCIPRAFPCNVRCLGLAAVRQRS
jgi:hypothetical protein